MEVNRISQNVSLKSFNTFGVHVMADYFVEFESADHLQSVISKADFKNVPTLILGGGSNILFTKDFNGLVLRNNIPGIEQVEDRDQTVLVKAGSGVTWHSLVKWCIDNNLQGVENLSLIPGKAGAAPMQNIGAYGVELKDVFYSLKAIHLETGDEVVFYNSDCEFGYRESVFKKSLKGKVVITEIILELNKQPNLNLSYGSIEQELKRMGVGVPDISTVSEAVCNIRSSKLPDPAQLGNAGSFFKNPEVGEDVYNTLIKKYPKIVAYPVKKNNAFKLAAGWLIEQCGWKGKQIGNTGSHKDQALVLVNYGGASGNEILDLALAIQNSVQTKFGVTIEPEVNII